MAIISHPTWVSNTVSHTAQTMETKEINFKYDRTTGSAKVSYIRHHRNLSRPKYKFSIQFLHGTRTQQTKTDSRLSEIEQFCSMPTFQNGRCACVEGNTGTRGFHLQDRSEGRLRCGTHPSSITKILDLREQWRCLPIQNTRFWTECESSSIYKTHAVRDGTTQEGGYTSRLLSRRYLYPSEMQTNNGEHYYTSKNTSRESWFRSKLRKEHTNSSTAARIPGIYVQFQDHEDCSTEGEDPQAYLTSQTSPTADEQILSMICQFTGKNDSHDSSHRGSLTSHTVFTTRSCLQPTTTPSAMELDLYPIQEEQRRVGMVDSVYQLQKWVTNTSSYQSTTNTDDPCGCIKRSMGSNLKRIGDNRILDRTRKSIFYKRKRVDGYTIRLKTSCSKISKHSHTSFHRQHNSVKIRHQIRRYLFPTITRHRNRNSRPLQQVQYTSGVQTYPRHTEHTSRLSKSSADADTTVRSDVTTEPIQSNPKTMGTSSDRRICFQSESSTQNLLELSTGFVSQSDRCVQPEVAKEGYVSLSSLEINSPSVTVHQTSENRRDSADNTQLADSTLVSNSPKDETTSETDDSKDPTMEVSRLAIIGEKRKELGWDETAVEFLNHSLRSNTIKLYNNGWRIWTKWCKDQTPQLNPEQYDVDNVFKFLMDNRHFSVSHLNGIRSAIASTFKVLHPEKPPLASQGKIEEFFKTKRNLEVKIPKPGQLCTWDTNIITKYIKNVWPDNSILSLHTLQLKTVALMCLATMGRPRSDIGRLQYRHVLIEQHDNKDKSIILHFTGAKETQVKTTQLGQTADEALCLTRTLYSFVSRTRHLREKLSEDHTLFLTYLDQDQKETTSIKPSTIAGWLTTIMKNAGIDTKIHTPHSFRSASSTKAFELGHSVNSIKQHANWSQKSNTWEKHYFRPTAQASTSTSIANSIFSNTENLTTWSDETQSTRIIQGTTNNTNVDEVKSRHVVNPPSWNTWIKSLWG